MQQEVVAAEEQRVEAHGHAGAQRHPSTHLHGRRVHDAQAALVCLRIEHKSHQRARIFIRARIRHKERLCATVKKHCRARVQLRSHLVQTVTAGRENNAQSGRFGRTSHKPNSVIDAKQHAHPHTDLDNANSRLQLARRAQGHAPHVARLLHRPRRVHCSTRFGQRERHQ